MKYIVVKVCPVWMHGSTTGQAPIHVRRVTVVADKMKGFWANNRQFSWGWCSTHQTIWERLGNKHVYSII